MEIYLKGSGHFAFAFLVGFLVMLVMQFSAKKNLKVQIYSPFIPFILGVWASLPYFLFGKAYTAPWLNVFFFYDLIHTNEILAKVFARTAFVALFCGTLYTYIIFKYIALVKHCRKYGWGGKSNA